MVEPALLLLGMLLIAWPIMRFSGLSGASGGPLRVRVPIDDLAVGYFPAVCVKSGRPAQVRVEIESSEGTFQPWWLLMLFLGPIGVVAIVVLWSLARRASRVGGQVPVANEALEDYNRAVRLGRVLFVVGLSGMVAGVGLLALRTRADLAVPALVAVLAIVVGLVGSIGAKASARRRWVDVELDGSGRWATLIGVHPAFALAVSERQLADRTQASP